MERRSFARNIVRQGAKDECPCRSPMVSQGSRPRLRQQPVQPWYHVRHWSGRATGRWRGGEVRPNFSCWLIPAVPSRSSDGQQRACKPTWPGPGVDRHHVELASIPAGSQTGNSAWATRPRWGGCPRPPLTASLTATLTAKTITPGRTKQYPATLKPLCLNTLEHAKARTVTGWTPLPRIVDLGVGGSSPLCHPIISMTERVFRAGRIGRLIRNSHVEGRRGRSRRPCRGAELEAMRSRAAPSEVGDAPATDAPSFREMDVHLAEGAEVRHHALARARVMDLGAGAGVDHFAGAKARSPRQ